MACVLVVIIPMLVVGWHCAVLARAAAMQPPHLKEIIDELSSIRIPTGKVVANHANTELLYVKYTENDTWGAYLFDMREKKTRLLGDVIKNVQGVSELDVQLGVKIIGWSPQDTYFAYARGGKKQIVICNGNYGREVGQGRLVNSLSSGAWLSPTTLVCSDGDTIVEFYKASKGWKRAAFYAPAPNRKDQSGSSSGSSGKIKSLVAYGSDEAMWQEAGIIYAGERDEEPHVIWRAANCELLEFAWSSEANKILLHCKDEKGEFLAEYYPGSGMNNAAVTNVMRLEANGYKPTDVELINNGQGYAYLNQSDVGLSKLIVKVTRSSPPLDLPWHDDIKNFTINQDQLYTITSSSGEPPGIWTYNLSTKDTRCLVSSIEQPFKYAAHAPVQQGYVTNSDGEQLTYYLLQPTKPDESLKHPMVVGIMGIGEPGYTWDRLAQLVANCGGYFVCMDRRTRSPDRWADDAYSAYEFLSKNAGVDTNKVYLFGISAGVDPVGELLNAEPKAWRGAFLFSQFSYPTLEESQTDFIWLDVGVYGVTNEIKSRLFASQDRLAASGIRPILIVHPNAGHIVRSIRLERQRMEQIAALISQP